MLEERLNFVFESTRVMEDLNILKAAQEILIREPRAIFSSVKWFFCVFQPAEIIQRFQGARIELMRKIEVLNKLQ